MMTPRCPDCSASTRGAAAARLAAAPVARMLRLSGSIQTLDPFHDADIAVRAIAERIERGSVAGGIVRRLCRRDAVKFDNDAALVQAILVSLCRRAARQKFAARGLDRGAGKLRIRRELVWIGNRAIGRDPIRLGHSSSPFVLLEFIAPRR